MRRFGRFNVTAVEAGRFGLDGGAMFGVVPKPLWSRGTQADESNRIDLATRLMVVEDTTATGKRRILVDTGIGDKFPEKQKSQFKITQPAGGVREALTTAGVDPDSITDVILTHLHFDHAGGATSERDGTYEATFPNATYHLQRRAWKWAEHPTERDSGSFRPADFQALAANGQLHLFDGPQELFPGVSLMVSEGHTVAQQLVLLDGDDDGKLLYCADVMPTRAHLKLAWVMGYDLYPLTTLEEKRMILAQGLEEDWTIFFEHDPTLTACKLAEKDGNVVVGEELTF